MPALLLVVATFIALWWNAAPAQAQGPPRQFVSGEWTRLWTIGGSESDTLLISPTRVVTTGAVVYVLDGSVPRLLAIDLATGRLLWTYGHRGRGPGEFMAMQSMARWPGGGVVVADAATGRMTVIDEQGKRSADIRPRAPAVPFDICVLGDTSILVVGPRPTGLLSRYSTDGSVLPAPPLPEGLFPEDGMPSRFRWRGAFTSAMASDCVVALQSFSKLLRIGAGRVYYSRPTIEAFDARDSLAQVADVDLPLPRPTAALSVWTTNDEIGVPFDGRTEFRGLLIDVYRASDGEYLRTLVAPRPPVNRIVAAARSGRVYILLHGINGLPALSAFRFDATDDAK